MDIWIPCQFARFALFGLAGSGLLNRCCGDGESQYCLRNRELHGLELR